MNFNLDNRGGGETRTLVHFANTVGQAMQLLYEEEENEDYRQALKDTCFEMCRLLEPMGIPLNRTPLTTSWLDSIERRDLRREGKIK